MANKTISQDTFDDFVKENIIDFSMSPEEAKEETIKQFEAQGINLANIIKDLAINPETGKPLLNETIDCLKTHIGKKSKDKNNLLEYLTILDTECQKSISHRVLAAKNGAHEIIISLFEFEVNAEGDDKPDLVIIEKCLKAVNSLINKQPDIFDAESLAIVLKLLKFTDENILCLTVQWLQKATVMHELNRQNILNAGIIKQLKPFVTKETNTKLLREILMLFRFLVLDDDIRVEYSCSHEHARQIASEVLVKLTKLLGELSDTKIIADIMLTIGTLTVRQELCMSVYESGGLELLLDLMKANQSAERINREALKLLRALAGNDTVKGHMVRLGVAPIIKELLEVHAANENIVSAALACVSILTLRVKENSNAFFEAGIIEPLTETLRLHRKSKTVQRNAAWAIRNMVSRSREQNDTWLSHGVEELLNTAMSEHPLVESDIKSALRDLGCKIQLKEEWKGVAEKPILNK